MLLPAFFLYADKKKISMIWEKHIDSIFKSGYYKNVIAKQIRKYET